MESVGEAQESGEAAGQMLAAADAEEVVFVTKYEVSMSMSLPFFVSHPHGRPCWFSC